MHNFFKIVRLIICFIPAFEIAFTQTPVVVKDSIFSHILNEQRNITIALPKNYTPGSGATYGVVYILDGETHFDDFLYIYSFAQRQNFLPPLIIVAVPNTYTVEGNMRDRDFTPEKTTGNTKGGGADNFIAFFQQELMPYIDKKFPVSGENSLFGHSLGGLFTMYVLLKEPDLFSNYFCSDPAIPWNNMRIVTMAEETLTKTREWNNTLWIIGVEETYRNVGIGKMDSVVQTAASKGLRWKTSIYPNETHMSVRLKGIYDGLKYTYDGYNAKKMVEFHPNNGSLLKGKPVSLFLNGRFPQVHFTTDGSEPDTSSKQAPQMIQIAAPAVVTVKWLGENTKYITSAKGNFEVSSVWPALHDVNKIQHGGMRFSYYEGKWNSLPDFSKLNAIKTGVADSSFSFEKLPAASNFGCVFEGYLKIDLEGYYSFALCSSDGSRFFINNRAIINNDGLHGSDWYKSYVVPLQKGFYPVRIEYFQREGNRRLDMIYFSPTSTETVPLTFTNMYFK